MEISVVVLVVTNANPSYVEITSLGDDSTGAKVTGEDKAGGTLVENITGTNKGTAFGKELFKVIKKIEVNKDPGGQVEAGVTEQEVQASSFVKETDVSSDGVFKAATISDAGSITFDGKMVADSKVTNLIWLT